MKPSKNPIKQHNCCKFKQSDRLNLMLKVSSFLSDTPTQSIPPLVDSFVNVALIKVAPFVNQSFFQMTDDTDPATVDLMLQSDVRRTFWIFQDGGCRHLGFLTFKMFNSRNGEESRTASLCQISSKSHEPRSRYDDFFDFSKMAAVHQLDL